MKALVSDLGHVGVGLQLRLKPSPPICGDNDGTFPGVGTSDLYERKSVQRHCDLRTPRTRATENASRLDPGARKAHTQVRVAISSIPSQALLARPDSSISTSLSIVSGWLAHGGEDQTFE